MNGGIRPYDGDGSLTKQGIITIAGNVYNDWSFFNNVPNRHKFVQYWQRNSNGTHLALNKRKDVKEFLTWLYSGKKYPRLTRKYKRFKELY